MKLSSDKRKERTRGGMDGWLLNRKTKILLGKQKFLSYTVLK